jgi:hypothetical protein
MIFKVYTFFNELSSEDVRAKTELSKCQELRARACNVSVSTVACILKRKNIIEMLGYIICILEISCLLYS